MKTKSLKSKITEILSKYIPSVYGKREGIERSVKAILAELEKK